MSNKIRMVCLTLLLGVSLSGAAFASQASSTTDNNGSSGSTTSQRQASDHSMDYSWLGLLGLVGLIGLRGREKNYYGDTTPSTGNNKETDLDRDRARI